MRKSEKEKNKTKIPTIAAEGESEANGFIWGPNSEGRSISKVLQSNGQPNITQARILLIPDFTSTKFTLHLYFCYNYSSSLTLQMREEKHKRLNYCF